MRVTVAMTMVSPFGARKSPMARVYRASGRRFLAFRTWPVTVDLSCSLAAWMSGQGCAQSGKRTARASVSPRSSSTSRLVKLSACGRRFGGTATPESTSGRSRSSEVWVGVDFAIRRFPGSVCAVAWNIRHTNRLSTPFCASPAERSKKGAGIRRGFSSKRSRGDPARFIKYAGASAPGNGPGFSSKDEQGSG